MDLLKSDFITLVDIFENARKEIIISVPALYEEVAEALIQQRERGVKLYIYIELNETVYRYGYGDIIAYEKLHDNNIEIFNLEKFNIHFIITDLIGYFYFPKSRFIEKEGISFDLFPMKTEQVKHIKMLFNLLDYNDPECAKLLDESNIEQLIEISKTIKSADPEESKPIIKRLISSPPLKPDIGRIVEVYRAKFQFIEMTFKGANIHVKKIRLPAQALPLKDEKFNKLLETNLLVISSESEKKFLEPFFNVKKEIDQLRDKYFHYLKAREMNIINRDSIGEFEKKIKTIKSNAESLKEELIDSLQDEITNTRKNIFKNLIDFYNVNTPEILKGLTGETLTEEIKNYVHKIISKMKFPFAKQLLNEIEIKYKFYDITWDDLNDEKIINELLKMNLINENDKTYINKFAIATKDER